MVSPLSACIQVVEGCDAKVVINTFLQILKNFKGLCLRDNRELQMSIIKLYSSSKLVCSKKPAFFFDSVFRVLILSYIPSGTFSWWYLVGSHCTRPVWARPPLVSPR